MKLKQIVVSLLSIGMSSIISAASLQEVAINTIEKNPKVLAAANELKATFEEVNQARSGYFPTIDLEVGTGWESSDNPTTRANTGADKDVHKNRDEASIRLNQMLFDGMATKSEVSRQQARADSRKYKLSSTIQNQAMEASQVYLNVLRQQQLLELALINLSAHERTFDQIELRSDSGVDAKADIDQSQGRLALAKANVIAQEANLRDAEINYIRVVGLEPSSLTKPDLLTKFIPVTLEVAIEQAINNHPTLKSAQSDIESANFQYDAAQASFLPRVDFELGATANNDLDGVNGHNNDVTAMFKLRYNLLNGGKDKARSQETAHLINQAAEIRNNTYREVEQSVRLSWNALIMNNKQFELYQLYVVSSEKSRDAYQQQFNFNKRSLLDLLDSENEVFTARQNLVNSEYDKLIASYRLLNSMGMLLEGLNIKVSDNTVIANK